MKSNEASSSRDAAQTGSKKNPNGIKTFKKWMKELNIDLDFDDLVVTQIICKTGKLFALANIIGDIT